MSSIFEQKSGSCYALGRKVAISRYILDNWHERRHFDRLVCFSGVMRLDPEEGRKASDVCERLQSEIVLLVDEASPHDLNRLSVEVPLVLYQCGELPAVYDPLLLDHLILHVISALVVKELGPGNAKHQGQPFGLLLPNEYETVVWSLQVNLLYEMSCHLELVFLCIIARDGV